MSFDIKYSTRSFLRGTAIIGAALSFLGLLIYCAQLAVVSIQAIEPYFHPWVWAHRSILRVGSILLGILSVGALWYLDRIYHPLLVSKRIELQRRSILGVQTGRYLLQNMKRSLRFGYADIARPGLAATGFTIVLTLAISLAYVFGNSRIPRDAIPSQFSSLLQVQATFAAAALPILLFVIRFPRSEVQLRQPGVEVLLRFTYVVPIFLLASEFTLAMAAVGHLYPSNGIALFGLFLVSITIAATMFAFYRMMWILYDMDRFRDRSSQLIRERFRNSLERSTRERIGSQIVLTWLANLNATYSPIGPLSSQGDYVELRAAKHGSVSDMNLGALGDFVRALPWRPEQQPDEIDELEPPRNVSLFELTLESGPSPVTFQRIYGDDIAPDRDTLVYLDRRAFELDDDSVSRYQELLNAAYNIEEAER